MTLELPQTASDIDETATRQSVREEARARLGVVGDAHTEPFRLLLTRHNLSAYPMLTLGLLAVVDNLQGVAFTVLSPDISRSLGIGVGAIATAVAVKGFAVALSPLPMAALSQRKARRAMLCIITAFAWSLITLYTGVVVSYPGLLLVLVLDGLSTGSVSALHVPLLIDSYPPAMRVRVLSWYTAVIRFGSVLAPLLVALLAGGLGFTWRGVFLAFGLTSTAVTLLALGLRDPGFGTWDTEKLKDVVAADSAMADVSEADHVELGFWEICRRLLLIPTNRRLFTGAAVLGVLSVPYATFLSFFLAERWGLGPFERSLFFAFEGAVSVIALLAYGARGEKQFRKSPASVFTTTSRLVTAAIAFIVLGGLSPWLWGMVASFSAASACLGVLGPAMGIGISSIIPARMRPHASALFGIFVALGGFLGALFFTGIQARFGIGGAILSVALPGLIGAFVIGSAGKFIGADLDRMIDDVVENEEVRHLRASGAYLPLLSCRRVNFSYGQLQVLFDVDFKVDDGEMVALLGVNGAGKSTLLKVVSGVGLPSSGSVRLRGRDITYVDAERRVGLGITQIPGGRAVFPDLTVVENLRCFGYTADLDRRSMEAKIEECFGAFPSLDSRSGSLAGTLSGGEQQMLGLSKALVLQPELLVIDELSLGLAPIVVGQLLDMVRRINAGGTAVVLVEQSVNIALNLVERAYFMEKGQMRFEGRAADLLARDDLLRAVFLHGSAAAVAP